MTQLDCTFKPVPWYGILLGVLIAIGICVSFIPQVLRESVDAATVTSIALAYVRRAHAVSIRLPFSMDHS